MDDPRAVTRRALLAAAAGGALAACGTSDPATEQPAPVSDPTTPATSSAGRVTSSAPIGSSSPRSTLSEQDDARIAATVAAVSIDRLMADIRTLAAGPRHAVEDHDAALAAAEYVAAEFTAAGLRAERVDVESTGVRLPTVWTTITGTDCEAPVLVLTGHYDTVPGSPGADDDASGVAAVLEAARVLADRPPRGSVVLSAVPFEEHGSLDTSEVPYAGSRALVRVLADREVSVAGMISAEMLGYATDELDADGLTQRHLNVLGYQGAEALVEAVAAAAERWVPGFEVQAGTVPASTDFIGRSDHRSFHDAGHPAAFATDGANFRTPYYHTPQDVPENVVTGFLTGCTRTLVGWLAAHAPEGCR